ncbi:MAG TPA: Nif3-like dinuclear metal center hexameric protein [Nitrososphaeraceae archaeon]|nr:Nif3-like dinuclear metal center hexameric protein [Nitrososphaeraceae archaeon]
MDGLNTEELMKIGLKLAGWKKIPSDSAIHVKGSNIKKVFVSIDVSPFDIYLAKTQGCDCVLTHHPIGKSAVSFHKVFDRHVEYMMEKGVKKNFAISLVKDLKYRAYLKSHSLIYNDVISTAQILKMPLLNIHQPLDEYMRKVILFKLYKSKLKTLSDLIEAIEEITEFKKALTRILICNGKASNEIGNWVLVIAAGSNGGYDIARTYYENNVSTVIYLHIDYNELKKVKKDKTCKNLIILGHLAGDSIGMNKICNELEKRGIVIFKRGLIDDNNG